MARPARTELAALGSAVINFAGALRQAPRKRSTALQVRRDPAAHVQAARRLNRAAGILATSVLADSAVEHYRGSFENRAMYVPLVVGALSLAVSGHGVGDRRTGAHAVRDTVYAIAGATGLAGTGFHLYNITKRPGGFSWLNLFYAAPIGAPMALLLSGLLGFTAERVRDNAPNAAPRILGFPAGRAMAALSALGMLGTVGEAGLLHFRGAYHDPAMFLPVSVPPVAAGLLGNVGACAARQKAPVHPLVAAADRCRRAGRCRFPYLRRVAEHGRLAQLVAERSERAANPGPTKLHRTSACGARGIGSAGGPLGCVIATLVMTSSTNARPRPGTR